MAAAAVAGLAAFVITRLSCNPLRTRRPDLHRRLVAWQTSALRDRCMIMENVTAAADSVKEAARCEGQRMAAFACRDTIGERQMGSGRSRGYDRYPVIARIWGSRVLVAVCATTRHRSVVHRRAGERREIGRRMAALARAAVRDMIGRRCLGNEVGGKHQPRTVALGAITCNALMAHHIFRVIACGVAGTARQ